MEFEKINQQRLDCCFIYLSLNVPQRSMLEAVCLRDNTLIGFSD